MFGLFVAVETYTGFCFSMRVTLEIPDEIFAAARLPEGGWERAAKKELALAFYARGVLSLGKAVELAETSRMTFEGWLAERKIERPFSTSDLTKEVEWAGSGME